jgi:hypothetical protein
VVAARVMRLAHAHGVVGEVDIAVVAEELRHGCDRGVGICRSVFSRIMRLSYSARWEVGSVVEGVVAEVDLELCWSSRSRLKSKPVGLPQSLKHAPFEGTPVACFHFQGFVRIYASRL